MLIGGLQKTTLIDYPGKVAATVFTLGCSFRCPFCHNPELVLPKQFTNQIPEREVIDFLASRVGKLDGVCLTGGEPTLQKDLLGFIREIKDLGLLVKLDTNGSQPRSLEKIIEAGLIDYLAMDIKGPINKYSKITATNGFQNAIAESIWMIKQSGIDYEFRTTVAKPLLEVADFSQIGQLIEGARIYWLQNFVKSKQVDEEIFLSPFTDQEMKQSIAIIQPYVLQAKIRALA